MQVVSFVPEQRNVADAQKDADEQNHKHRIVGKNPGEGENGFVGKQTAGTDFRGNTDDVQRTDKPKYGMEQDTADEPDIGIGVDGFLHGFPQSNCHKHRGDNEIQENIRHNVRPFAFLLPIIQNLFIQNLHRESKVYIICAYWCGIVAAETCEYRNRGGSSTVVSEEEKTEIYANYQKKVLAYLNGKVNDLYVAEDICAEVFLKVYEKLDTFDETKASVSTWIFTITRNTLTDYFRTRRVFSEIPEELSTESDLEESYCNQEMLEVLADALTRLPERERDLIILHYYSGKTLKEVAEHLDISYAYVKILHNKALAAMKKDFCL